MAITGLREAGLTKARIEALTDGIFATVMTVFVLGLRPPTIDLNTLGSTLSSELFKLAPSTVALVKRRILVGPAVFSTGIAVSFVSPLASTIIFFLPIFYYILPGHIDVHIRGEHGHEEK